MSSKRNKRKRREQRVQAYRLYNGLCWRCGNLLCKCNDMQRGMTWGRNLYINKEYHNNRQQETPFNPEEHYQRLMD